ncbi:cadherin-like beta sandwich domain-containing protein [Candidatus Saccharibacteria bacterium]|nr:cadherin-like beta sandwich domain-containing protein [Candidatus Saccharibacteria bacterium]
MSAKKIPTIIFSGVAMLMIALTALIVHPTPVAKAAPGDNGMAIQAYKFDYDNWTTGAPLANGATVNPGDWLQLDFMWQQGAAPGPQGLEIHMMFDKDNVSFIDRPTYCEKYGMPTTYNGGMWPSAADNPVPQRNITNWSMDVCNAVLSGGTSGTETGEFISMIIDKGPLPKRLLTQSGRMFSVYVQVKPTATPGANLNFYYDSTSLTPTKTSPASPLNLSGISLTVAGGGGSPTLSDDNSLGSLSVTKTGDSSTLYALDPAFSAGNKPASNKYSTTVPYETTSVDINATKFDSNANLVTPVPITKALSVGTNTVNLITMAEDGTIATYTVEITRQAQAPTSSDGGMSIEAYKFDHDAWATGAKLTDGATVNPGDWLQLDFMWNQGSIPGPQGLEIHMMFNKDALSFVDRPTYCEKYGMPTTYNGGMWPSAADSPVPQRSITNWSMDVCNAVLSGGMTGTETGEFIGMIIDKGPLPKRLLTQSGRMFSVYVQVKPTATPGAILNFYYDTATLTPTKVSPAAPLNLSGITLNVAAATQSSDNSLGSLAVTKTGDSTTSYTTSPTFTAGTKPTDNKYTVTVPYETTSVDINATKFDTAASMTSSLPITKALSVGSNTVNITVTAENGTAATYQIEIVRQPNSVLSSDNSLNSLSVTKTGDSATSYTLTPTFVAGVKPTDNKYTTTVPNATTSVTVNATASDATATLTTAMPITKTLNVGVNTVNITVIAEDAVVATYTVEITREPATATPNDGGMSIDAYRFDHTNWTTGVKLTDGANVSPGEWLQLDFMWNQGLVVGPQGIEIHMRFDPNLVSFVDRPTFCEKYNMPTTYNSGMWPSAADNPAPQRNITNWSMDVCNAVLSGGMTGTETGEFIGMIIDKGPLPKRLLTQSGRMFSVYVQVKSDAPLGSSVPFNYDSTSLTPTKVSPAAPLNLSGITLKVDTPLSTDDTLGSLTVAKTGDTAVTYPLTPTLVAGTKPANNTYSTVVPYNTTSVEIAGTMNDAGGSFVTSMPVTQALNVGDNTVNIIAAAEDGTTETYTIQIKRLNNFADLGSLSLTSSNINIGTFASNTTTYSGTVPYATATTNVNASVTAGSDATITSGTGAWNLTNIDPASNSRTVTVAAENCDTAYASVPGNECTTKDYTINVLRHSASTDADLSDLSVDGVTVPSFNPITTTYTLPAVTNSKTSINIAAVTQDTTATLSGDLGSKTLAVGNNTFIVTVTAEDGTTTKNYTINIYRKSSNNNLSTLSVTSTPSGTFAPTFSATTFNGYTYTVNAETTAVTITAALADPTATITGVSMPGATLSGSPMPATGGSVTFTAITNGQVITVSTLSEDGDVGTYTITIVKNKSTNADLATLAVSEGTLTPNFASGTTNYTVSVDTTITSINVAATVANPEATVSGTGTHTLNYGSNTITVTVTAEDTSVTKNYVITVNRAKKTDATITDLKTNISGTMATVPGFPKPDNTYDLGTVPYAKATLNISAVASDADIAGITGDGVRNLAVGLNTLTVTVTAQDGTTTADYTIIVTREAASSNADLASLSVKDASLTEYLTDFDASITTYNVTVPGTVSSVNITAVVADSSKNATMSGDTGTKSVSQGNNPFSVTVTAEDGSTKTYNINVHRQSDNNYLSSLSVTSTPSGVLAPTFTSTTFSGYTFSIGSDVDTITINATLADPNAMITGITFPGASLSGAAMPASGGSATYTDIANGQTFTISTISESGVVGSYVVTINKTLSQNTNLASLAVNHGSLNPTFAISTTNYTVAVASSVSDIDVTATPEDSHSTIVITSGSTTYPNGVGIPLATGDNTITVKVTAEDGVTTKDYTVTVRRLSNDSSLASLSLAGITLSPVFAAGTTAYNMTVPYATATTTVSATANDAAATIVAGGTGTWNLTSIDPAVNSRTVTVQAENCQAAYTGVETCGSTTYTLNVTREAASTNANLIDLTVNNTTVPGFSPSTTTYNLPDVDNSVTSINLAAVVQDTGKAALSGDLGNKTLSEGDNTFVIKVTAEDGVTTKDYTINIRRKSSNNKLSSITLSSTPVGVFAPVFSPNTTTGYTYTIDPETMSITANAALADSAATITGTTMPGATLSGSPMPATGGSVTYTNVADGQVLTISTISENGDVNSYSITIVKGQSINADLATLTVSEGILSPAFAANTTAYTVDVAANVSSIDVTATAAHPQASVTAGTGTHSLNYGANTITVTVTAENTSVTKDYVITVNRAKKTDATITDLKTNVSGTMATVPGFPNVSNTYDLGTVPYSQTSLNIAVTANDADITSITGDGSKTLAVGLNTFTVVVTAQDGTTTANYTVTVTREAASTNANLSDLSTDGVTVPSFSPNTTTYTLATVENSVTSIDIAAVVQDTGKATLSGDLGTKTLSEGNNTFIVKVTAEDGTTTKNYTINIRRKSSNNDLDSLTVSEGSLTPAFDPSVQNYTVTVASGVNSLVITATSADSAATVTGDGTKTLVAGSNEFDIIVTAEDGTIKTYQITVNRPSDDETYKITSNTYGHDIDDDYILSVTGNTSPSDLKDQLDNPDSQLTIYESDGTTEFTGTEVGTGMIVKLIVGGEVKDQKTIVVLGDVNGDGNIDSFDGNLVSLHFRQVITLAGAYAIAADCNKDTEIDSFDGNLISLYFRQVISSFN